MRSTELCGPRSIRQVDIALPDLSSGQVLVRVEVCAICGSDLRRYRDGRLDGGSFGHEFAGTIEQVCGDCGGLREGDVVTTGLLESCGACRPCQLGYPNFCEHGQATYLPGGFGDTCIVSNCHLTRTLVTLPEGLSLTRAALHEPVSCALRIVRRAQVRANDRVAIVGLGAMGVLSGLLLMHPDAGATITGIDRNTLRRSSAERCGFAVAESGEPGAYDVVIDATGDAAAFAYSLDLARLGGTVVVAGVPEGAVNMSPLPIFRKELTVLGAKGPYPYRDDTGRSQALDFLIREDLPWDHMVRVYPFERITEAFSDADHGAVVKAVVMVNGARA